MGMIPIALAIAGFVLLWMIVNYQSLSAKRTTIASLQLARENLLRLYVTDIKQLSAMLRIYGLDTPAYLINLANEKGQKIDRSMLSASLQQVELQVRNRPEVLENPDFTDLMRQTDVTIKQLLKNQQALLSEIKGYNGQATQMPYRIVAQLFGFKRISPPVV
jgi:hypothetical protein